MLSRAQRMPFTPLSLLVYPGLWVCVCEELQDQTITLFQMLLETQSVLYYLTPSTTTLQFPTFWYLFTIKLTMFIKTLGRKDCVCLWKIHFKKLLNTTEHEIGFSAFL